MDNVTMEAIAKIDEQIAKIDADLCAEVAMRDEITRMAAELRKLRRTHSALFSQGSRHPMLTPMRRRLSVVKEAIVDGAEPVTIIANGEETVGAITRRTSRYIYCLTHDGEVEFDTKICAGRGAYSGWRIVL